MDTGYGTGMLCAGKMSCLGASSTYYQCVNKEIALNSGNLDTVKKK